MQIKIFSIGVQNVDYSFKEMDISLSFNAYCVKHILF